MFHNMGSSHHGSGGNHGERRQSRPSSAPTGSHPYLPSRYPSPALAAEASSRGGDRNIGSDVKSQKIQQAETILLQLGPLAYLDKHTSICYVLNKDSLDVDLDTPAYNYILPSRTHRPYLYSLTRNRNIIQAQGSGIINFSDSKGNIIPVLAWYVPRAAISESHPVMVSPATLLAAGYLYTSYSKCHYQFKHPQHGSVWVFRIQGQFLMPIKTLADIDAIGDAWCRLHDVEIHRINQNLPTNFEYVDIEESQRDVVKMNRHLHTLFAHADQTQVTATFKEFLCSEVDKGLITLVDCGECREYVTEPRPVGRSQCSQGYDLTFFVDVFESPRFLPGKSTERTVCFEEVGSGFLYLRNVQYKHGCLTTLHNLISEASRERRIGRVRVIKASRAERLLTITREDVHTWFKNSQALRPVKSYLDISERNLHLDDEEFDALCWNKAHHRVDVSVTSETKETARPDLERFIVKLSKKLLSSLGLPTQFAQLAAIHFVNIHNMMYGLRLKDDVLREEDESYLNRNLSLPLYEFSRHVSPPSGFHTFGCLVSYRLSEPDQQLPFPRPGHMGIFVGISSDGYEVVDLETHEHHFVIDVEFYPGITPLKYEYPGWKGAPPDPNGAEPQLHPFRPPRMDSISRLEWRPNPHDVTVNFGDSIARNRAVPVAMYFRGTTESLADYTNRTAFELAIPHNKFPIKEITSTLPETIWEEIFAQQPNISF